MKEDKSMEKQAKIREFFSKLEAAIVKNEAVPYELLMAGKALRPNALIPPPTSDTETVVPVQKNFGVGLPPLARC
jgi:hypothetical protein